MDHRSSSFLSECAPFIDLLFSAKEMDTDDEMRFTFFTLDRDDHQWNSTFNWPSIAMATIKPEGRDRVVLSIGPRGDYYQCVFDSTGGQALQSVGVIPAKRTFLATNLVVAQETIFAVGMGRAVSRWDGPGVWTAVGPEAPFPEGKACGFSDMTGPSLNEMYAVGWLGEIWRWQEGLWRQIDSPTSARLRAACTLPDGTIIAVGYDGAMVRGRHDEWQTVDSGRSETLLDVCCFEGKVFVATAFRILTLEDSGLVPVTHFADPEDIPVTCGALHPTDDGEGVFSMGPHDLFLLHEGRWARVV